MSTTSEALQDTRILTVEQVENFLFDLPIPGISHNANMTGNEDVEIIRDYSAAYRKRHSRETFEQGLVVIKMLDSYEPHVNWALTRLYETRVKAYRAGSPEEIHEIMRDFRKSASDNPELMDKAVTEMKVIDAEAEKQYLETMHTAVKAHADGDFEAAAAAEERLSQTSEIDVRALRARIAIDAAFND